MNYLFNNKWKKLSGWIFYLSLPLGIYAIISGNFEDIFVIKVFSIFEPPLTNHDTGFVWFKNSFIDESFTFVIIITGIVNSFCKEKIEDELISKIRLESLTLSLFISYGLIILSTLFIYGFEYLYVLEFNLFLIILLFNLIFKYRLYKHYKS